jgi:ArsR family transcriptional regulator
MTPAPVRADDLLDVLKALSNPKRLQIMAWLREPTAHFEAQADPIEAVGVLQRAGLVESTRIGPWTYYRRNDATVDALPDLLGSRL